MRHIILACLLFSTATFAETKKDYVVVNPDIYCFNAKSLLKELKNKYGEEPIFIGQSEQEEGTVTMMYVNQKTGSYTVLSTNKDVACVFDTGNNVKYRMPKVLESKLL